MKKNILVIGGTGLIGSEVVKKLSIDKKYKIFCFSHKKSDFCISFAGDVSNLPEIEFIYQNYKINVTLILFGQKSVEYSFNTTFYTKNDFLGLVTILNCCEKYSCNKVIYLSSSAIYKSANSITEKHEIILNSYYSFLKIMSERLLEWYRFSKNIDYVILRCFNVVGFSEDCKTNDIISLLFKNSYLNVFGKNFATTDGTLVRDYVYVVDVADAIEKAIEYKGSNIFNIGTGVGYSILQIIKNFETITSRKINFTYLPRRSYDQDILVANISKAKAELNWEPSYSLEKIIKTIYRKNFKKEEVCLV